MSSGLRQLGLREIKLIIESLTNYTTGMEIERYGYLPGRKGLMKLNYIMENSVLGL